MMSVCPLVPGDDLDDLENSILLLMDLVGHDFELCARQHSVSLG